MPQFIGLLQSPRKLGALGQADGRSSAQPVHHPMEMIERAHVPAVVN